MRGDLRDVEVPVQACVSAANEDAWLRTLNSPLHV